MPPLPYPIDWAKTGQFTVCLVVYVGYLAWIGTRLRNADPTHWPEWDDPEQDAVKDFPEIAEDDDSKLVA